MDTDQIKPSQAESELLAIRKIMEDSRSILIDDGLGFITWGLIVFTGLMCSYLSVYQIIPWNTTSIIWIALIGGGWIFTFFQVKKEKKQNRAVTFAGKVAGAIWGSAGICMTLIGFGGSYSGLVSGFGISPLMCCVLGGSYYVSGIIYGYKSFKYLGFGWWAGAILMFAWKTRESLLIFALMIFFMQVVPGILLYRKWKKENKRI